jgi:transcriptional antiterminator NusG
MEQNEILTPEVETEVVDTQEVTEEKSSIEQARDNADWYALHTYAGYENVAKENLEIVIDKYSLQERVFDIIIPMEDVVEEKKGKREVVSRRLMPGYIFVKMIYGDDIWHAITRTRGITGFVGPKGRPIPLTEDEIHKMRLEKKAVVATDLTEGDKVEVLEGALNGFVGTVVSVDAVNNKCRVIVEMFGRETPVDLSLEQVKKVI